MNPAASGQQDPSQDISRDADSNEVVSVDARSGGSRSADPDIAGSNGPGPVQPSLRIAGDVAGLLRIAAFCLYGVFLTTVVPLFLPPRLLDPAWQLLTVNTLFSASPFPLLATCCLLLGRSPDPRAAATSRLLVGRLRLGSRLASLGFVLLVPLQISALWRAGILAEVPSNRLISTLSAVRTEIEVSRTRDELNTALAKLPGSPKLPANFNLPIPDFQKATSQRLSQDISAQKRQQSERIRNRRLVDAFNLAKNSVLAALLSIFFAAAAGVQIRRPSRMPARRFQPFKGLRAALEKRSKNRDFAQQLRQYDRLRQQKQRRSNPFRDLVEWIETGRMQRRRRAEARQIEAKRVQQNSRSSPRGGDRSR